MDVSQALDDIKAFLSGDPLVQAAVSLNVPASDRQFLADILGTLQAQLERTAQDAADQARADAATAAAVEAGGQ